MPITPRKRCSAPSSTAKSSTTMLHLMRHDEWRTRQS